MLSPDLRHDVALSTKVLIAQGEKVVDDKGLWGHAWTAVPKEQDQEQKPEHYFIKKWNLITVPDGVKVNIVVVGREEKEGKPGDKSIPDKTRDWKFEEKEKSSQIERLTEAQWRVSSQSIAARLDLCRIEGTAQ